MKKSIVTVLIAATLVSSFAGIAAAAQGRGGNGGGSGRGGSDGMEYRLRHTANQRYVEPQGDVFCFLQKVRRYDAYGNRFFEHVRTCETRIVDVY